MKSSNQLVSLPFTVSSVLMILVAEVKDIEKLPAREDAALIELVEVCNSFRDHHINWQGPWKVERKNRDDISGAIELLLKKLPEYETAYAWDGRFTQDDLSGLDQRSLEFMNRASERIAAEKLAYEALLSALEQAQRREIPKVSHDGVLSKARKRSDWAVNLFVMFKSAIPFASDRDAYRFIAAVSHAIIGGERQEAEKEIDAVRQNILDRNRKIIKVFKDAALRRANDMEK